MTSPVITKLILIRHARTSYDKSCVPPENPPLDPNAKHDYSGMRADLPDGYRWIVSPLSRCQDTADQLFQHGATWVSKHDDSRLREQSYGNWHEQNVSTLWQNELSYGDKHNWHFLHPDRIPPEGESFAQLMAKLRSYISEYSTENTVLITHGMVIRAMVGLALDLSADQALSMEIAPLSMTGLSYMKSGTCSNSGNGGEWQLNYLNRAF